MPTANRRIRHGEVGGPVPANDLVKSHRDIDNEVVASTRARGDMQRRYLFVHSVLGLRGYHRPYEQARGRRKRSESAGARRPPMRNFVLSDSPYDDGRAAPHL